MTTTEEIRRQIEENKQFVQEQRELVEQKRQEVKKAETFYSEQEKKIPKPTARLLRSGMFAGLEGRKRLRLVESAKKEIGKRKGEVGVFKEGLTKYEKEQLEPFEAEIEQEGKKASAYELLNKLISEGYGGTPKSSDIEKIKTSFSSAGLDPKEGEKIYTEELKHILWSYEEARDRQISGGKTEELSSEAPRASEFFYPKQIGAIILKPSEQKYVKGLTEKGHNVFVVSEEQMKKPISSIFPLSNIKKDILSFEKRKSSFPSFSAPRGLSRTEIVKDWKPLSSFGTQTTSPFDTSFRTTGSPVRVTKLTSSKSRGYIPTTIKQQTKQTKKSSPIFKIKTKPKKIKKSIFDSDEDFLFGRLKKNKKKKYKKFRWF